MKYYQIKNTLNPMGITRLLPDFLLVSVAFDFYQWNQTLKIVLLTALVLRAITAVVVVMIGKHYGILKTIEINKDIKLN